MYIARLKRVKKNVLCLILMLVLFPAISHAKCDEFQPRITLRTKPGRIKYITTQTREEFIANSPTPASPNTVGLTVTKLNLSIQGKPHIQQDGRRACVGLKDVIFEIGYDTLDVYIDRRYKPGSCEYKEVKAHENYHVAVSNQAMSFFKPDLEKALKKAVAKMRPEFVYSNAEASRVAQRQFDTVLKEVQPIVDHINKKITEKNYAIDTPESYRATTARCSNW